MSSASSRRDSVQSDASGSGHRHRRSISRSSVLTHVPPSPSVSAKGHGRRASKSRASRGSISMPSKGSHGHTRSRASISISISGPPSAGFNPGPLVGLVDGVMSAPADVTSTNMACQKSSPRAVGLDAPASWSRSGAFPSSPELASAAIFSSTSNTPATADFPQSHFSNPSLSNSTSAANHGRRASRHNRRSSVANFRESLDLVSGIPQSLIPGGASLQPTLGSFSPATPGLGIDSSPPSPSLTFRPSSPSGGGGWQHADPVKVLEALKERGRRESDGAVDPAITRSNALEALEGRVTAPSEIIDLGNEAEGELLVAPPSPGYMGSIMPPASPSASTLFSSPMPGQGFVGKRNSWGAPGPVAAAGAKGAMDLGMLVEEEEEESEEVAQLPQKRGASPKKRPTSLFLPPASDLRTVAVASPADESPLISTFSARPMRLSLSLSPSTTSVGTPSTAASPLHSAQGQRPPALRSLTLGGAPSTPPQRNERASSPVSERRSLSLFHSVAVETANNNGNGFVRLNSSSPVHNRGGLRSLSIGSRSSPVSTSSPTRSDRSSPTTDRRTASTSTIVPSPSRSSGSISKRSSISYKTTNSSLPSSIGSPDLSFSAVSAARRNWRNSASLSPVHGPSTPSSTLGGYAFPFTPSHGHFGGFGDLEVEETDDELVASPVEHTTPLSLSVDPEALGGQLFALAQELEQMKIQNSQLTSSHALQISEFEKKAGDEARGMRMRISELERAVEEGRIGRKFEVDGLSREVEQAREAMADLTDERDSLKEDVDGWRERCATLQHMLKKDQEDDALATAQAKLIGEMRDQIYNLVAALERERGEHVETRNEIHRLLDQQQMHSVASSPRVEEEDDDQGTGISSSRHGFQTASDGSVLSTSSFGRSFSGNMTEDTSIMTDMDDSFSSKYMSSPPSGHSSFGSKRDSELGFAAGGILGGLDTLAEEEEIEDELPADAESRVRHGSRSTGSTGTSEGMPPTPSKEPLNHHRSDSFVRHWSVCRLRFVFLLFSLLIFVTFDSSLKEASVLSEYPATKTILSSTSTAMPPFQRFPSPNQSSPLSSLLT